ncbi:hypothetical protein [Solimonas soli]|uniref:hypothetical protein n=1 Tax=Solimonas soli TaxID=413479 RepID=UPI0012F97E93|nr:hypothetical protein [Solimonas soli]
MNAQPYRRIVCLAEPASPAAGVHQAALLAIAGGCPLRLLRIERSRPIDFAARLFSRAARAARDSWLTQARGSLETIAGRERRNGALVDVEVLWGRGGLRAWCAALRAGQADLVVREAGALGRGRFRLARGAAPGARRRRAGLSARRRCAPSAAAPDRAAAGRRCIAGRRRRRSADDGRALLRRALRRRAARRADRHGS